MGLAVRDNLPKASIKVPHPSQLSKSSSTPLFIKPTLPIYGEGCRALMNDLKDLRRAGNTTLAEGADGFAGNSDLQLMDLCTQDCNDTGESLRNGIELLKKQMVAARTHGAARHPTVNVSEKSLVVLERKLVLLAPLEDVLLKYQDVVKDGVVGLVEKVLAGGDPQALYGHAFGIREVLEENLHRHPPGRPQDVEMYVRHTEHYMKTFGLNAEHKTVLLARKHLREEMAEAAELAGTRASELCLQAAANKDGNPRSLEGDAINRLEVLLEGLGTHPDHPGLTKVGRCKEAARSAAVLRWAELQLPAPPGGPDKAYKSATRVEDEVQAALEFGVFPDHPDLMKAATVGHHLRAEGVRRFAQYTVDVMGKRLGDAEAAAIKIEDAIKEALKLGVPVPTEELEAARKIAVGAREVEGLKKREHNAEMRKAKAAKEAAK